MKKALLCIGAGRLQQESLRWAREAGLFVVATDRSPQAHGRELADRFECLDGRDVDGLLALALELQELHGLAGAWSSNDFALEAVAHIGAATRTPANRPDVVRRALDKDAATRRWRERGVATSRGRLVQSHGDLDTACQILGFPLVVKPVGASGSVGVSIAASRKETLAAFDNALALSEDPRAGVLLEAQLLGKHLDVNAYFRDGVFRRAGILERCFTPAPRCVPLWGFQPSSASAAEEQAVWELVESGARALGLEQGPLKADVVLGADGPALLEMAPRFHGDVSSAHVSRLALGKSPIQAWFASLAGAGGPFDDMPERPERVAGWMALLAPRPGVLRSVSGLERARRVPGVTEVLCLRSPGWTFETLADNRAVAGFVWAEGRTRVEVEERLRRAHSLVEIEVEAACPSLT